MSVPRWGGRLIEALTGRLYIEGNASLSVPNPVRRRQIGLFMAVALGCCVLGSVRLGLFGFILPKYMQPVSALYVVPFLVGLKFLMGRAVSYVSLLWPLLYGLHAILIVAGAPIVFTEPWGFMNMALPIAGYGLLAAMVGHAYNRYTLHKLMRLMRTDDTLTSETDGASQR